MRIVFCCTGNTCRSPIAEYLLKDNLSRHGVSGVEISSCGVSCQNDAKMSSGSKAALLEVDIDASEHKAKSITMREILEADYIFTMTTSQKQWICDNMNASKNVLTLGEFVCEGDVIDPFMGDAVKYRECRNTLAFMVRRLETKLFNV